MAEEAVKSSWQDLFDQAQRQWHGGETEGASAPFYEFFELAMPWVFGLATKSLGRQEAEDVALLTMAEFAEHLQGAQVRNVKALMRRILNQNIKDHLRGRARHPEVLLGEEGWRGKEDELAGGEVDPEEAAIGNEFRNAILDALSPSERQVIELRIYEDLSTEETAMRLGITVDIVKKRRSSAIKKARVAAERLGYLED